MKQQTIKINILFFIIFNIYFLSSVSATLNADISCYHCHTAEISQFINSTHFNKITCKDCHGGNIEINNSVVSTDAMSDNFKGNTPLSQNDVCGKCHLSSTILYKESIHWEKLKEGASAASCTDCHGTHNILSSKNSNSSVFMANVAITCAKCHEDQTRMQALYYGIKTDKFDTYKKSFHYKSYIGGGKILATCSDCHENHNTKAQNNPTSAINYSNLPNTCGKTGCHVGANNIFITGGKIHEGESVYIFSFNIKKIVTYFYIFMVVFELAFTFGLIFLGISSKFDIKRRH